MRAGSLAVALLLVSALASVAAKPRREYLRTYDAYTEHVVVYFGFSTALNMRATLLTRSMREALHKERVRLMSPSDENAADFEARMARDLDAYHEIVFSADTAVQNAEKFGTTDAHWNLRMTADGVDQPLVAVEHIRRPTPVHFALYPHLNIWSELWIARFERVTTSPRTVEVVVGSGYGSGTLTYELSPR